MSGKGRVKPSGGSWERHLLWSGMLAPLVAAVAIIKASAVTRSVNPLHQSISLLMDGPAQHLLEGGLIVSGGLILLDAWAVGRVVARGEALGRSLALTGAGLVTTGAFMQHRLPTLKQFAVSSPWGPLTAVGIVHVAGAAILYAALLGSCWAAMRGLRSTLGQWASGVIGVVLTLLLIVFLVTAAANGPAGLFERLIAVVAVLWEGGLTVAILKGVQADLMDPYRHGLQGKTGGCDALHRDQRLSCSAARVRLSSRWRIFGHRKEPPVVRNGAIGVSPLKHHRQSPNMWSLPHEGKDHINSGELRACHLYPVTLDSPAGQPACA